MKSWTKFGATTFLCSCIFVTPSLASELSFQNLNMQKQTMKQGYHECIRISGMKFQQQCAAEMRKQYLDMKRKNQQMVRKQIHNRTEVQDAIRQREKIFRETKGQAHRW